LLYPPVALRSFCDALVVQILPLDLAFVASPCLVYTLIMKIKSFFGGIKVGLSNLWAYLPIIWQDRDWDHAYLLDLWEFKFRRMARMHLEHGNAVGSEKIGKQLLLCAELCVRIREDKYDDVDTDAHDKKWGKPKLVFFPKENADSSYREIRFIRSRVKTDADAKQELEESQRYTRHAQQQRINDLKYLSGLISDNLLNWWD
jgi:hypothetical protein